MQAPFPYGKYKLHKQEGGNTMRPLKIYLCEDEDMQMKALKKQLGEEVKEGRPKDYKPKMTILV